MKREPIVKLYGRMEHQTSDAILFYVTVGQDAGVPRAARCRSLWFPKSRIHWYVDGQGREVLSLRLSRLKKKLAEESSPARSTSVAGGYRA